MPPHFGPRIVGDVAYQAAAEQAARAAHHFGPRVVGTATPSAASMPADPQTPPSETPCLSIAQLT